MIENHRRRIDAAYAAKLQQFVRHNIEAAGSAQHTDGDRQYAPAPTGVTVYNIKNDTRAMSPEPEVRSILCTLPWNFALPPEELTEERVPPDQFKSKVTHGILLEDGSGELNMGVGAGVRGPVGFPENPEEYPARPVVMDLADSLNEATCYAGIFLSWNFPWPASEHGMWVDFTVDVELPGYNFLEMRPANVAGALGDATLALAAGAYSEPPGADYNSSVRFLSSWSSAPWPGAPASTSTTVYRTFPVNGTIYLRPGATFVSAMLNVNVSALYIPYDADNKGFASVSCLGTATFNDHRYFGHTIIGAQVAHIRVAPPRVRFSWIVP